MRLAKEYQVKEREQKRKALMLTSLNTSTKRLHEIKPRKAIIRNFNISISPDHAPKRYFR